MTDKQEFHHNDRPEIDEVAHIIIDGHKIRSNTSSTIIKAARAHGINIASLCSDPRLKPTARCGMCLVDIEGQGIKYACQTQVVEGMRVVTETDEIVARRREILSSFLSNHNAYCEPPCHYACPAGIDIPAYIGAIARGDDGEAVRIIKESLPLPRIIGRVCPRPCEDACRRTQVDNAPVAICQLKRFAADKVAAAGVAISKAVAESSGRKVAVIGSGPTGLSVSYYLALAGHQVTIFEANGEPGGMMRSGIPSYRLPKDVIDDEVNDILNLGVEIKYNSRLGSDFSLSDLKDRGFDSIYLAIGAQKGTAGGVDEPDNKQVWTAVDFLDLVNKKSFTGSLGRVVVVGGGFTAMDAARSSIRLGAKDVSVVYRRTRNEMPAAAMEVKEAEAEGVKFTFLTSPCSISREGDTVVGVVCEKMELGPPDDSGRRRPIAVEGTEFIHDADTVIFAVGQEVDINGLDGNAAFAGSLEFSRSGTIKTNDLTLAAGMDGVFAGGDCERGPATVVEAIADGRRAAVAIDAYLGGRDMVAAVSDPMTGLGIKPPKFFDIGAKPLSDEPRAKMPELTPAERSNFDEIELGFTEETARAEAARCLQCKCHEASACELQRLSQIYGAGTTEFNGKVSDFPALDASPMFLLDRKRCIQCHNCVRICDEVQQQHVYTTDASGYPALKNGGLDFKESGCVFCGQCVSACPTGALKDLTDRGVLRKDLRQTSETTCPYCGIGCNFDVEVEGDRVVAVSNRLDAAVNEGNLCIKGRFGFSFHDAADRLKMPLIRESRDQEFREVSWEEALSFVAERYLDTLKKDGPDAFAMLTSSRGLNEENYVAQKFFRTVIKTNNVDNCARVCHAPSVAGLSRAFGSGAATNPLADIQKSDVLLVTGSNTTEAHPIAGLMIKKAITNGAKLIVADPRRIELAERADHYLQLRAGTNVALLNGLMHVIIRDGLLDTDFIQSRTEDFELVKQLVMSCTPEKTEEITEVPAALIEAAARTYALGDRSMILYGLGMTEHRQGSHSVMCMANLAMATGNVGRPGAGIIVLRGQNNVQGSCDMGALPDYFTGYQKVTDAEARTKFEDFWGVENLATEAGLKEPEMYRAAINGDIKVLHVIGYDPAKTQSNLNFVREAYDAIDFVVVQDIFLTETARRAHVILPAACYFEKEGTFTNGERRIQRVRQVISPPSGLASDWEVVCRLAQAMGSDLHFDNAAAIMDEIAACTPQFAGVSYERLETEQLHWPVWNKEHEGAPMLHHGNFTKGLGTFHDIPYAPSAELPDGEYPLLLTTGRVLYHYCNGSMTMRTPIIEISPEELLEISPADAVKFGVVDQGKAIVESRRGQVEVRVSVTERSAPGTVFLSFHFDETPVNLITGPGEDELALTPEYKVCAVRVRQG